MNRTIFDLFESEEKLFGAEKVRMFSFSGPFVDHEGLIENWLSFFRRWDHDYHNIKYIYLLYNNYLLNQM